MIKFKVRGTIIYEWEETSDNWPNVDLSKEAILHAITNQEDVASYILDGASDSMISAKIEPID